jgi:hypothetical protein
MTSPLRPRHLAAVAAVAAFAAASAVAACQSATGPNCAAAAPGAAAIRLTPEQVAKARAALSACAGPQLRLAAN